MTHYKACGRIYHIKSDSLETYSAKEPAKSLMERDKKLIVTNIQTKNEQNILTGLLAHYDSDSESENPNEDSNKLDEKVDNFLQEIEQLSSNSVGAKETQSNTETMLAWQECYDESTGYPYYWNIETNAVTWEMPNEYKEWLENKSVKKTITKFDVKPEEIAPPISVKNSIDSEANVKNSQSIQETKIKSQNNQSQNKPKFKKWVKQKVKSNSDSEDEKIEMITSYSNESSSEDDREHNKLDESVVMEKPKEITDTVVPAHLENIPTEIKPNVITEEIVIKKVENYKDENIDETIALSRLKTQAKVRQENVKHITRSIEKTKSLPLPQSLSLVAGYGDDSDAEEQDERPTVSVESLVVPAEKESILFPITKPIDVKQFEQIEKQSSLESNTSDVVDTKIFKRKRRLGIELDVLQTTDKRTKAAEHFSDGFDMEDKKGFGFRTENDKNDKSTVKNQISFVKADVLNPVVAAKTEEKSGDESFEDYDEVKEVVSEKVHFLCEGKDGISHVQVMLIQLQTLEAAYRDGGLCLRYLYDWLRATFTELTKLEQDAAPQGWCCQWDRSNKRYYYRNEQTGETQWQYPEPDIVGGAEAMDICTTPPPEDVPAATAAAAAVADPHTEPVPNSPPEIGECSPSPPSSPAIKPTKDKRLRNTESSVPSPPAKVTLEEPLPPGVDSPDFIVVKSDPKTNEKITDTKRPSFGTELDSFYSDIALIEASTVNNPTNTEPVASEVPVNVPPTKVNSVKKKKKAKIGKGITMKKKAVSSLVEKWKQVQNDYI